MKADPEDGRGRLPPGSQGTSEWRRLSGKVTGTRGRPEEWAPLVAPSEEAPGDHTPQESTEPPAPPGAPITCARVLRGRGSRAVATVKDDIVEHVEEQPDNPSTENQQRRLCLLGINVPFDGFHQDAEHQGHGENGVAEGSQDVRPREAERALLVPRDAAGPQAKQADDHGKELGEDGEGVGGQGQGVADVGDGQLHHEQEDAHHAHEDQAEAAPGVSPHGAGPGQLLSLSGKAERPGEQLQIL